jgi:aerobic-type carbon monoxide dehydrogenase small subunit (CoxS/CutS family)
MLSFQGFGMARVRVNGEVREVAASADTPLLYVLSDELGLKGPRFGCGLAQCGSCSVLADGVEIRSCVTPLAAVMDKAITTLEGLPALYAAQSGRPTVGVDLHPVQQAMIDVEAMQCGYCYNGMIIKAAELLAATPDPTDAEIVHAMNGHICRCGTYPRIKSAIKRASRQMRGVL